MTTFVDVARSAATRHGLVTRGWLRAAGVPEGTFQHWIAIGRLEVLQRGVYRVTGAPVTWRQSLLAAVLAAGDGAVASHRSAARLWRLIDGETAEVSVPVRRNRRLRGAVVHYSADLAGARVLHRSGIPTTTPMRALVDLAAVVEREAVEDALERALTRRLLSVAGVEHALDEVARRGRPGAGALRRVLDDRALGAERPDSLLEPRMARLIRSAKLPPAVFQHEVWDGRRFVARVDFAYPSAGLAVEVDGFDPHGSRRAFQRDRDRQNELVALGWTVVRFTWLDVVRRPSKVAAGLRRMLPSTSTAKGSR
ncbi:MAG TPA: DUF559 domain-containing protein [Acidimicrobiales bacterium]|nr:DUF559 domain-containing protein [Acidimicrobiales bacterium]